jgi:hypothetical protein
MSRRSIEREMDELEVQLQEGIITDKQYRQYMRELQMEMNDEAEEAAKNARDNWWAA